VRPAGAARALHNGVLTLATAAMTAAAVPARAQAVEMSFEAGYTTSEGITASQPRPILGNVYNSLDITSGSALGFTIGAFVTPHVELEFLYHRQSSSLEISDPAPSRKLASQDVENYHGNVVYNWGESGGAVRPFALFGLGATHYLPGDYDSSIPNSAALSKIATVTKFSTTLGGGVKFYPSTNVGFKGTIRWTPTYIKSDSGGVWCDPFYPTCWVLADPDYSNQLEFSGGITLRFGGR
jgi:opacity protein-like surface antigen